MPADAGALRQNNFDALRLAMALAVVWSHSFAIWYGTEAAEPVSRMLGGENNSGTLAVLVFFTISGFLITHSWLRSRSPVAYLAKRVGRIVPGYLVAVTLCSLAVVPLFSSRGWRWPDGTEAAGLASNLLLRNYIVPSDAFGGGPVNGSLWSIPYEFWCYLGVLALGLAGLLGRRMVPVAIAAMVMAVRVWLDLTGRRPGGGFVGWIIGYPYLWFVVLPAFALGMAIYRNGSRLPRSPALLALMVALLVGACHLPLPEPDRDILPRLLLPPTLAYAIFAIAFSRRLRLHGAARYGDFSYGTYLYAYPIQQMLAATLKGRVSFGLFVLLSLAAAFAAGVLSWLLVERWFVARRARRPLEEEAALVAP